MSHELKAALNGNKPTVRYQDMRPKEQINFLLESKKGEIAKMLPSHLSIDRLLKVATIAATSTPALLKCDVPSLVAAIGQCAQMGMEPNTVLGSCYLLPFKCKRKDNNGNERWVDSVQVIVGYRGLIDLARRSGQIVSIAAHEVCKNDHFELIYGLEEKLEHRPALDDRGEVIGFYAVAKLKDGGYSFEFMSLRQVNDIMVKTQSKGAYGPWKEHFIEMGRKGLALDTPIPTPDGWTTMEKTRVGDIVFDMHGKPVAVTDISEVKNLPCFSVTFGNNETIICDDEHRWVSRIGMSNACLFPFSVHTVNEMLEAKEQGKSVTVPVQGALELPKQNLLIEPYLLGYWLGDGHSNNAKITCWIEDLPHVCDMINSSKYEIGAIRNDERSDAVDININEGLRIDLREIGVLKNKHVPAQYLRGSIYQRRALLKGLMDSDGHINKERGKAVFSSTNANLANSVYELAVSLGETPWVNSRSVNGYGVKTITHEVGWQPTFCCVSIPRKVRNYRERKLTPYRTVKCIKRIKSVPTKCIAVEGETKTYLAGHSMTPTHNTVIRRLSKYLPLSIEFQTAVALDTMAEVGKDQHLDDMDGEFSILPDDAPTAEPEPEETIDEDTGEIFYPEEEPPKPEPQAKPDPYALGSILKSIGDAKTQPELELVHIAIAELDNDAGKTAKSAFTKRQAALKKVAKPVYVDWENKIESCTEKQTLIDLIETMSDSEQAKFRTILDEKLDYLRD